MVRDPSLESVRHPSAKHDAAEAGITDKLAAMVVVVIV